MAGWAGGRAVLPKQLRSLWTQFLPGSSISVLCAAPLPLSSPSLEASLDLWWGLILAIALPGKKIPRETHRRAARHTVLMQV